MAVGLKRKRRRKNMEQAQNQMSDKNEHFVFRHTADLLIRHLDRYPVLDEELLEHDLLESGGETGKAWVNSCCEPIRR